MGGGGGGGVKGPGPPDSKKLGQRCFVIFAVFLVLTFNLFNSFTEGTDPRVRWFIFWKTIIFQGSRGGPTFFGVGGGAQPFFQGGGGGVKKLISVETYRNCDFPGPPIPSLYPRMFCLHLQLGPSNRSTFVGCVQALRDGTKFSLIYTCKGRAVAQW